MPGTTTANILEMEPGCQLAYFNDYTPAGSSTTQQAWAAGIDFGAGRPAAAGCYAIMPSDGNLVIYAPNDLASDTATWASNTTQSSNPPNLVHNLGPYSLVNPGQVHNGGEGVEIISDSGVILWENPNESAGNAAADGNTAVGATQSLVGFLVFLLPFLL